MMPVTLFSALQITAISLSLTAVGCSGRSGNTAILEPGKVSSIVIGQSSSPNVLAALGRPNRVEWNQDGERWVYEVKDEDLRRQELSNGATLAGGVLGALVPFGGLVGTGLGLAGSQVAGSATEPALTTFTVAFSQTGLVRDCMYAITGFPGNASDTLVSHPALKCQGPVHAGVQRN